MLFVALHDGVSLFFGIFKLLFELIKPFLVLLFCPLLISHASFEILDLGFQEELNLEGQKGTTGPQEHQVR